MKQFFILLAVLIAFGASGRVFGIDKIANESTECVGTISIDSYYAAYD